MNIECDCGDQLHVTDSHDHVRCGNCGALISISITRLTTPTEPIFNKIPQAEFRAPTAAAVDKLRNNLNGVLGIVLHGSVARGEADRRSDIDLWVLVSDDRLAAQRKANRIREELEEETYNGERYKFEIDVETRGAVENYADEIQRILENGIALLKTNEYEQATQAMG